MMSSLTRVVLIEAVTDQIAARLSYWSEADMQVLILDGSLMPLPDGHLAKGADHIRYEHAPGSHADRLTLAAKLVQTKYVVVGDQDDLYLAAGLRSLIEALEADHRLVAAAGHGLEYRLSDKAALTAAPTHDLPDKSFHNRRSAVGRAVTLMRNYAQIHRRAVLHTNVWRAAVAPAFESQMNLPGAAELQLELIPAFLGQSSILPVLTRLTPGKGESTQRNRSAHPMRDIWVDEAQVDLRHGFLAETACHLSPLLGQPEDALQLDLVQAMNAFAAGLSSVPLSQRWALRELRDRVRRKTTAGSLSLNEAALQIEGQGIAVSWPDLERAEACLLGTGRAAPGDSAPMPSVQRGTPAKLALGH